MKSVKKNTMEIDKMMGQSINGKATSIKNELAISIALKKIPLILLLLFTLQAKSQDINCDLCTPSKTINNEDSPLAFLPIQQNLLITSNRNEQILLKLKKDSRVNRIEGYLLYDFGNEELLESRPELSFTQQESNDHYPTFYSNPVELTFDDWVTTYKVSAAALLLSFFEGDVLISQERYSLDYININPTFLNSLPEPPIAYLLEDSTIVHFGNSIYVQYEKVRKKYIDESSHFLDNIHGSPLELETVFNSIWQEPIFVDYENRAKGLGNKLSTVFSFFIGYGNGNRFNTGRKSGQVAFSVLLNNRTFVHEMLHQYFPWFTRETISTALNIDVQSHHHIIFTGQSGFGSAPSSKLPIGYPILCRESFDQIETLNDKFSITIDEECNPNFVSSVDGLYQGVHSFYELFIMGLTDFTEIDFPFYYGANFEESYVDFNESVTWSFEELKSIDEETFLKLHSNWHAEKEEQFPGFFNAKEKNMLFMFFGTSPLTNDEYKVLSFISDELTKEKASIEVPQYAQEGDFKYNRYLSYNQSTLGLGHLTNEFPLPPNVNVTSTEDNSVISNVSLFPNPCYERFAINGAVPDHVQIFNLAGQIVVDVSNQLEVDVSHLAPGVYPVKLSLKDRVVALKLVKN